MEPIKAGDIHKAGQYINIGVMSSSVVGMGLAKLQSPVHVQVPQYTRWVPQAMQAAAARRMCRSGPTAAAHVTLPQSHGDVHDGLPQGAADCRRFVRTAQPQLRHFSLPLPQLPQV